MAARTHPTGPGRAVQRGGGTPGADVRGVQLRAAKRYDEKLNATHSARRVPTQAPIPIRRAPVSPDLAPSFHSVTLPRHRPLSVRALEAATCSAQ